jgi:hypothetical protein
MDNLSDMNKDINNFNKIGDYITSNTKQKNDENNSYEIDINNEIFDILNFDDDKGNENEMSLDEI